MKSVRPIAVLFAVSILGALTSCASVVSKTVVGDTPAELKPEDWQGTWMTPDKHVVYLRVKDAAKGVVEAAWVEVKNERFVTETHELQLRKHGAWIFANMHEGDGGTWLFGRVSEPDKDQILCWSANPPGFADAVRSGKLKGQLMKKPDGKESGSVLLEGLSDSDLAAIESGDIKNAFVWEHPLVLIRLSSPK